MMHVAPTTIFGAAVLLVLAPTFTRAIGSEEEPFSSSVSITATINQHKILGRLEPLTPAVTFDFWLYNDTKYGEKWGNASALTLNLTNQDLITLATALQPGLLRLGGSPEDSIVYDMDGGCVPGSGGFGGSAPASPPSNDYFCSQVKPYVYGCLSPSRWEQLLEFTNKTGLYLTLGLNACYGRHGPDSPADLSNIQSLLNYTTSLPLAHRIALFEYGNEVTHATSSSDSGIVPAQWVRDAIKLADMIHDTFSSASLRPPPIVGPDDYRLLEYKEIIHDVTRDMVPGRMHALTYHQYPECMPDSADVDDDDFVLSPTCLLQMDAVAHEIGGLAENSTLSVWAGESADHSGGGVDGVTNTFASSFYYAWQLGALPAQNVTLAARQCLVGGDYELVNRTTMLPNPDFYMAWLYRLLVNDVTLGGKHPFKLGENGPTAAAVPVETSSNVTKSGVQVYTFLNPSQELVAIVINLNEQESATVNWRTMNHSGSASKFKGTRLEYHVTGDPSGRQISINDHSMDFQHGGSLPSITALAKRYSGSSTTMSPASIAFVTFQSD